MLWPLIYPPANMGFLLACVLVSLDVIVHDAACSAKPHQGYSQEGAFNPKTAIGVSGKRDQHPFYMPRDAESGVSSLTETGGGEAMRHERISDVLLTDVQPTEHQTGFCPPLPSMALKEASGWRSRATQKRFKSILQ